MKPKDLLAWTIAVGSSVVLVAGICAFLIDWYHADFSRLEAFLLTEQRFEMLPLLQVAVVLGLAAFPATVLVHLFNASRGQIEFSALGVKFKGPAGPIVLWVVTFLATAAFVLAFSTRLPSAKDRSPKAGLHTSPTETVIHRTPEVPRTDERPGQ
jgi:hypothetical protein